MDCGIRVGSRVDKSAEQVLRELVSIINMPEFSDEPITPSDVAEIVHKDPQWVREGIVTGYFPVGNFSGTGNRRNFYISPKKLYELTGYIWRGRKK